VDASGTQQGTTYSFRNAQITPGTQILCSGSAITAAGLCTKVANPIIPSGGPSR
jgi:hypothetical protein